MTEQSNPPTEAKNPLETPTLAAPGNGAGPSRPNWIIEIIPPDECERMIREEVWVPADDLFRVVEEELRKEGENG